MKIKNKHKPKSKLNFLYLFIFIFIGLLIISKLYVDSYGKRRLILSEDSILKIENGSTLSQIASQLKQFGYLTDTILFKTYYQLHYGSHFEAGNYYLEKGITINGLMEKINAGTFYRKTFEIRSGLNLKEIADYWEKKDFGSSDDFLSSSKTVAGAIDVEALGAQDSMSCFLVADSFELDITMSSVNLVKKAYQEWLFDYYPKLTYAKSQNALLKDLTIKDLAILSSIVSQESAKPDEQLIIASIYLNRLQKGMPLQADPTVNYLVKSGIIDSFDTSIDNQFNTYKYAGLPPDCIAVSSQSAINSLLKATTTEDLYFISGKDGKLYTATTYQEHLYNIKNNGLSVGN